MEPTQAGWPPPGHRSRRTLRWLPLLVMLTSALGAHADGEERYPMQGNGPGLSEITEIHRLGKADAPRAWLFETGGGDPAINGNRLYLLYFDPSKRPPYEEPRALYWIAEVQGVLAAEGSGPNRVRLRIDIASSAPQGRVETTTHDLEIVIHPGEDRLDVLGLPPVD